MSFRLEELLGLLTSDRMRGSTSSYTNTLLSASESDKGRVINSSSFRRLQQKAQVFPLDENAAVRTRLTHSVEVSQVGRFLAQQVIAKFNGSRLPYDDVAAFVNTVETSCLLHDIGNPPFGHLGEAAIRNWFGSRGRDSELMDFDGNPQGFRIARFLSGGDAYGLNLTASQLLSSIKYPRTKRKAIEIKEKKFGIFEDDYEAYAWACSVVDWDEGKVFPLAKLMEAADDIAYCTSDLEDGLEKGVIEYYHLEGELAFYAPVGGPVDDFVKFKTGLITEAVNEAAQNFVDNIDKVLAGDDFSIIDKKKGAGEKIEKIKGFARKHIYSHSEVEKIELAGNSAIKGLLGHFSNILGMDECEFQHLVDKDFEYINNNSLQFDSRLFNRLPQSYVNKYKLMLDKGKSEIRAREHLVVDFISGMTDDFAIHTYQVLQGIKVR